MFKKARIGDSSDPGEISTLNRSKNFVPHGIAATALLTLAYFSISSLAESFDHAVSQFISLSYLFVPLMISFGIQIALLSYSRHFPKTMSQNKNAATSGGISTVSMIACCVHHLTDGIAIIGPAALALFLTNYQPAFILIGIVSNMFGIFTILAVLAGFGFVY